MKQVVFILLLLIFAKPAISQNEDLIREIENYILWVDSLIACCQDTTVTSWHSGGWYAKIVDREGFQIGGEMDYLSVYYIGDYSKMSYEKRRKAMILFEIETRKHCTNNRVTGHEHNKEYYKNGKLVAIKREWIEIRRLRSDRVSRMTIFVNNNEIIFFKQRAE